jgi:hypothetical protein
LDFLENESNSLREKAALPAIHRFHEDVLPLKLTSQVCIINPKSTPNLEQRCSLRRIANILKHFCLPSVCELLRNDLRLWSVARLAEPISRPRMGLGSELIESFHSDVWPSRTKLKLWLDWTERNRAELI